MASLDELSTALIHADKAGDTEAATTLANEIQRIRGSAPAQSLNWSDVPGQALANLPRSAANFAGGLYQAVSHPLDTASTLMAAAAGGLRNALPASVSSAIDKADWNPAAAARATNTADAVGQLYRSRYGSVEGLKNTLATDPVGAAADASALLGGGAALAPRASALGGAFNAASRLTNPITPIVAAGKGAANLGGFAAKQGLGLSTGVGAENIANAAKAGYAGDTSFLDNLTGKMPMTDVIDQAKAALLNMKQQKNAVYRSGMLDISKDAKQLDFANIDKAVSEASDMTSYKGQVINPAAAQKVGDMSAAVEDWLRLDPKQFHTPEGFDALKQKLGGIMETIPYEQKAARLAAGKIYNAVKDTITEQAPKYAEVMRNYSDASDLIGEIEKTLSLNPKASVDTALRKLQSLTRNNVSTNYGNRLDLASKLQSQGGANLLPAISGQAMSSWTPRGLMALLASGEGIGALAGHPALLAGLPLQSPKLVGALTYGAGRAVAGARDLFANTGISPDSARLAALLMQRGALAQP